jgi:hypothetical protein
LAFIYHPGLSLAFVKKGLGLIRYARVAIVEECSPCSLLLFSMLGTPEIDCGYSCSSSY